MSKTNETYLKKLCDALFIKGLNYDDVKRTYKYSGGSNGDKRHENYFFKCMPAASVPELVEECLCGHAIKENCYITKDFDINTILILGNCCIKKFIDKSSRTCEICNRPHRNRSHNFCNDCKKDYIKCKKCKIYCKIEKGFNVCEPCKNKACLGCNAKFKYLNSEQKCIDCSAIPCVKCNAKRDLMYHDSLCYDCLEICIKCDCKCEIYKDKKCQDCF